MRPSKAQPLWRHSFTTTQTPKDKLRNAINKARHDHPFLFPTLVIASTASVCWLGVVSYDQYTREKPNLGDFPPAVEHHLRNAIWYTEIKPVPTIAVHSFTKAIERAEKEGMDPFSPEFTGIHIRFAAALEKLGQAKGAIEILGKLADELMERIEDIDLGRVAQRKAKTTQSGESEGRRRDEGPPTEASSDAQESERGRLLKLVIECKVKISSLYESDHLQDNASAKRVMDEAMKLLIESMVDPKSLQFDENRAGISADEAAAMLNGVGGSNLIRGNSATALEIFKLALIAVRKSNKGEPSCREAFTLGNMCSAVTMMLDQPNLVIDGEPATQASIKQARQIQAGWAQQSLQCVQAVKPSEQDQFCRMAAMASWSHLGVVLEQLGDLKGARKMWEQVIQNSKSEAALELMVPLAQRALRHLAAKEKNQK